MEGEIILKILFEEFGDKKYCLTNFNYICTETNLYHQARSFTVVNVMHSILKELIK